MRKTMFSGQKPVVIRQVWASNADYEFDLIRRVAPMFPLISMDTEFPGVVYRASPEVLASRRSDERYRVLKQNVDAMKLIQVGLTFSDSRGNLPDFDTQNRFVWEINFSGLDVSCDLHAPESIELLTKQGIDLEKHRVEGIDPARFARLMYNSGLVLLNPRILRWITFHGGYDFAYLLKVLTGRELPDELGQFYELLRMFFGERFYDVKHMTRFCDGLYGGLEKIGRTLGVEREAGKSHCAGSDSLLTKQVFEKICRSYFSDHNRYVQAAGTLSGLEWDYRLGHHS